MDANTAVRLLDLNRQFYQTFGREFAATRRRLQPGVRRMLETLGGDENILDLGCGNGEVARTLARRGHRGGYVGLDFSRALLEGIEGLPHNFKFIETDLAGDWQESLESANQRFHLVTAFAVLHHIPGDDLRMKILQEVHALLSSGGRFVHSEWQFLKSEKLKARLQPWEQVDISAQEVDRGDYLIDWRQGGRGLRYVHSFETGELASLAQECGFRIAETFSSDGEGGHLSLYQVWSRREAGRRG